MRAAEDGESTWPAESLGQPPPEFSSLELRRVTPEDNQQQSGSDCRPAAQARLQNRRSSLFLAFGVAITLHFALSSAAVFLCWPDMRVPFRLFVIYSIALPELILFLNAVGARRRQWTTWLGIYAATVFAFAPVAHHPSILLRLVAIVFGTLWPLFLGFALIIPKRMRSVAMAMIALIVVGVAETALVLALWSLNVLHMPGRQSYHWAPAIAANLFGACYFLWMIRGSKIIWRALALLGVALAAFALQKAFPSLAPVTALVMAQPIIVFGCFMAWLVFRGLSWIHSRRRLSQDLLQLYLGWGFLTYCNVGLVNTAALPQIGYQGLLAAAAFPVAVVVLHYILRRYVKSLHGSRARRLVLLRVFAKSRNAFRLVESLRDTWRLFGSVDLISGPDLAQWIVAPAMIEASLRNRVEDVFLKSAAEVDKRISCVDRGILQDGRYPVNEFSCFSNAWRHAIARLVPDADVVLMDVRGFSEANRGCAFELQYILNRVPIPRILLIADDRTDTKCLQQVIAQSCVSELDRAATAPKQQVTVMHIRSLDARAKEMISAFLMLHGEICASASV